jgi:hypothetical protein
MSKEVSYDDIAQTIDQLFAKNRRRDEENIDLNVYAKVVIREIQHHVLCKNSKIFDLWLKIKDTDNLITITNKLSEFYQASKFTIVDYDELVSYVKCEMHDIDVDIIKMKENEEQLRYLKRSEVLKELEEKNTRLKDEYGKTMTMLNEKSLEIQEKYEKKLRELKNEQAIEKIKLDNIIAETPKKFQDNIKDITEKIALLKKCSHGFMYDGTVFANAK